MPPKQLAAINMILNNHLVILFEEDEGPKSIGQLARSLVTYNTYIPHSFYVLQWVPRLCV